MSLRATSAEPPGEPLPDGAEWTEHGWRIDLPGRIDPRPAIHWSTGVVALAVLLVGIVVSPWMALLFLPAVLITLDPRGGTPIHGLELKHATLEVYGLAPVQLEQVREPIAGEHGVDLTVDGVRRTLAFTAPPRVLSQLAERLQRDIEGHGSTEDVPSSMQALREAET